MYTAKGQLDAGALLKQYQPLVRRLAHQMIAKLPANVELDDLIQVGMIGLSDALSRFDAAQGVQFETFATQRIRGAMLDELRGNDWMSRGDRKQQRQIEAAVHKLEQYSPLVRRLAHQMIARLPANVEIDDLIQVGMIGLHDAMSRFDPAQGVQFETFATQRIRGAMLDDLRSSDWMSRGDSKQQRQIEAAVHKLEQQYGRAPAESEIAKEMGLSLGDYQDVLTKVRGTQLVYLEDMTGDDGDQGFLDRHVADASSDPLSMLNDQRMREALVDAIKLLPEREQYVMSMYYEHDMNLKEIAAVLKVTESRVCQLHSQSIARLRVKLREQ